MTNTATGEVLSTTYLFSICGSDDQTINPDWDGGGGVEGQTSSEFTEEMFNQYVQQISPNSTVSINGGESSNGSSNIGQFTWVVVQGAFSSWAVKATTLYNFEKNLYYNNNNMEYSYNFLSYQTSSSGMTGSNTLILSTWQQGPPAQDYISDNGSPTAKGHSIISGNTTHRTRFSIRNPLGGSPITLEITESGIGGCIMTPN